MLFRSTSWIRIDVLERKVTDGETKSIFGKIRFIDINENSSDIRNINELISKQNTLSYSLLAFQKEGSLEDVVNHILEDILMVFRCSRTYVFMYDFAKQTQSCAFEAVAKGVSREKDSLQDVLIEHTPWVASFVLNGLSVVVDDIETIGDINEKNILRRQNIKSLMISPMFSDGCIIGYIGVDCVDYQRKWTDNDYKWISTLANIISVSYDLYSKTENAIEISKRMELAWETNEDKLKSIFDNVPVGIEIYDKDGILIDINQTEQDLFGIKERMDVLGVNIFENPNLKDSVKEQIRNGEWIDIKVRYDFDIASAYFKCQKRNEDSNLDLIYKGGAIYDSERSEERRGGKACTSWCRSRWSPDH